VELDEHALIELAKKDPGRFGPVYEKYHEPIFRFVYSRIGQLEASKDVTSSVFYKALANLKKYRDRGLSFSSWLYRIALNECYDFFRAKKKHRIVALDDYLAASLMEELQFDDGAKEAWMNSLPVLLESLGPRDLELIEMRFFEGKSFREVAEILDMTENNAKTRTYRLLEKMNKEVKKLVSK
jgi:RNA polymerase sigma-70 factor, ECF subfamily